MSKTLTVLFVVTGIVILAGPIIYIDSLVAILSKEYSVGVLIIAWATTFGAGLILVATPFVVRWRREGRAYFAGQPKLGLAGKPWGPLASSALIPLLALVAPVILVIGYFAHLGKGALVVLAFLWLGTLSEYWRIRRHRRTQQQKIEGRGSANDDIRIISPEAIEAIARVVGASEARIRGTDRFGYELGSLANNDETLDQHGGLLLIRQRDAGRELSLERIRTVREYAEEWARCRKR